KPAEAFRRSCENGVQMRKRKVELCEEIDGLIQVYELALARHEELPTPVESQRQEERASEFIQKTCIPAIHQIDLWRNAFLQHIFVPFQLLGLVYGFEWLSRIAVTR